MPSILQGLVNLVIAILLCVLVAVGVSTLPDFTLKAFLTFLLYIIVIIIPFAYNLAAKFGVK